MRLTRNQLQPSAQLPLDLDTDFVSDEKAADIKKLKGYVSDTVERQEEDGAIDWVYDPPEQVRCMPTWEKQSWRAWNETLY